ncbi:rhodanese-like domain-containing protein [Fodinibius halophilus]|uniref:Rhodanese-like domain-containing protein n=1 Tax=Fodinibius halophilus TaxID=1736908 RepID=A0A6M1T6L6_9BACT|nr:rhodanese-like domain-containing protein [Fodinibius halophilus]NGP87671.1 rhodanese-like domain-containing protein [Fodinibius halophilus]
MNTALIVIILLVVAFGLFYLSQKNAQEVLSPEGFKEKMKNESGTIIDVRTADEYKQGHLKQADHNFDVISGEFQQQLDKLDKNETYFLYCRSGNRSGKAAHIMNKKGFENVYNVGGFQDLAKAGFETE